MILIFKDFKIKFKIQLFQILKNYFIDGWYIFIANFAGNFYRNFNTLVLGYNLYVGYYSIAEKIIKIIQSLQTVIGNVLFPYFSNKIKANKRFFFQIDKKYRKYIYSSYIFVSLVLFLFSPVIIFLIKGNYEQYIILDLKIMTIVVFIGGLNYYGVFRFDNNEV